MASRSSRKLGGSLRRARALLGPALRVVGAGFAIALVAGAVVFLDRLVSAESRVLLQSELNAVAAQAVRNAEAPISAAAQTLVEIARSGPIDCLPATVERLRERVWRAPAIVAFDVVDASGFLMCSSADEPMRAARLLPDLSPREPSITLAPDPREDKRGLLVAATIANGLRLVAELAPDLPAIPTGPAFAAERISVSLSVTDRGLWRRTGTADDRSGDLVSGKAASKLYPVVAEVVASSAVAPAGFRRIQLAVIVCGGLAVGALLLFAFARRKPKSQRNAAAPASKPVSHATPLYRPVVEIETGEIVGVDVVLGVLGDRTFGAQLVEPILSEMAAILNAHPSLMLSFTPVSSPETMEGIAAALARVMPKLGVDARQIVVAASPNAANTENAAAIRAKGVRLALDGVVSNEGGLMALATHAPDFITFGAEVLEGERELTILHGAAGIARKFDIGVVVRDVEAAEHIEWLRAVGVTTATGPAFGPALNAHSIAQLVAAAAHDRREARVA